MHQPEEHWALFKKGVVSALYESNAVMRRVLRDMAARIAQASSPSLGSAAQQATAVQTLHFLEKSHDLWVKQYPAYLLEAFSEVVDFDLVAQDDDIISSLGSIDAVSNLSIQAKSELMHANRTMEAAVAPILESLDGLVSAARGYTYARRDRNPLRPENYLQAMQKMVYSTEGGNDASNIALVKQFGVAVTSSLSRTYSLVVTQLSEAGVEQVQKRNTAFGAMTTGYGNLSFMEKKQPTETERLLTKEEILSALGNQSSQYILAASGSNAGGSHVSDQVATKSDTEHLSSSVKEASQTNAATGALTYQALMLDVVKAVAPLQPIKEQVALLQPALRKLVQTDPAFLRDADHPARLFLTEIQKRSRALNVGDEGALLAFATALRSAIADGHLTKASSVKRFQAAFISLQTGGGDQYQEVIDSTLQWNTDAVLEQVIAGIRAHELYSTAHARVQAFATGPWAKVITKSLLRYLKASAAPVQLSFSELIRVDPQGYFSLVPVLLGSVQAGQFRTANPESLRAIKNMYDELRSGLLSVGLEHEKVDAAVSKLKELHRQALQEASAEQAQTGGVQLLYASPNGAAINIGATPEKALTDTGDGKPQGAAGMQLPLLTRVTMGVEPQHGLIGTQAAELPEASQRPKARPGADEAELPDLRMGCWLLLGGGDVAPTQLTWVSPDQSIFMFTAPDGSSQTMTRRRLLGMYAQGDVRVLDSSA
ncbi:DUF1631 domain-containing protein [Lampropedia puyangensis]|uniref:DUF1631 domain-containing protein n=1 Tax=Lampropedia puyangensis TaxID=1330072 RepID=A0A4S8F3V4_9BURK|nr:DUF1631 family protein [Lampropedia puyangensis]THU02040.1 DUF1631 domain-containing protein [Lampropedia puyangensis]